jgi:hypothetical protein
MPQEGDGLLGNLLNRPVCVVIAIGTGENDYTEFHC